MTDLFKVYLPSNACSSLFPENTSTDFRTRFDKAIELSGKWEVGVESIAYSSRIRDQKEQAKIYFYVNASEQIPVNNIYPFHFHTSEDGQWKGLTGVLPNKFETDSSNIESVIQTLNAMNRLLLNMSNSASIFQFSLNKDKKVEFRGNDDNFGLRLQPTLARVLGFDYQTTFSGSTAITSKETQPTNQPLTKEDYRLRYMHVINQLKDIRLVIKALGERFDGTKESFHKLWKERVTSFVNVTYEFKGPKFILHNYHDQFAMAFSYDFYNTFSHFQPLIGRMTQWSKDRVDLKADHTNEFWYIDVYSTKLDMTSKYIFINGLPLVVYPWRSSNIKRALHLINSQTKSLLKERLKESYDEEKHYFQLTLELSDHCKLTKGMWLDVLFPENLQNLLSFPSDIIREREILGVREVDSLENHSRQLHILSNVIRPTAYGKQQRHILCDFLHKASSKEIIEKRFYPISYHPVTRNIIDMIHIQLTDEVYNPIRIPDSKTLVTLYFRKVK